MTPLTLVKPRPSWQLTPDYSLHQLKPAKKPGQTKKIPVWHTLGTIVLGLLLLRFYRAIPALLAAAAFIAFAFLPSLIKRKTEGQLPILPEFNTFGTVIMGVAYGPVAGATFGLAVTTIMVIVERAFNPGVPVSLMLAAGIGYSAQWLSAGIGVLWAGMALIVAATVIGNGFIMFFQRDAQFTFLGIIGSLVNFAINFILFSSLAKPLLRLLT